MTRLSIRLNLQISFLVVLTACNAAKKAPTAIARDNISIIVNDQSMENSARRNPEGISAVSDSPALIQSVQLPGGERVKITITCRKHIRAQEEPGVRREEIAEVWSSLHLLQGGVMLSADFSPTPTYLELKDDDQFDREQTENTKKALPNSILDKNGASFQEITVGSGTKQESTKVSYSKNILMIPIPGPEVPGPSGIPPSIPSISMSDAISNRDFVVHIPHSGGTTGLKFSNNNNNFWNFMRKCAN